MIRASVLYPSGEGATFDYDYYVNKHIPMVADLLGDKLRGVAVDRGVASGQPGMPPPYLAMAHLVFDSLEELEAATAPLGERLAADGPNYTNTTPTVQISEILSENRPT
jgi:uncharacterized protein (TIGR02118 family)